MYVNPPVIGKLASVVHAYTVNTAIKQILGKKPKKNNIFYLDEKIEIKCEMDFLDDLDLDAEELDAEIDELKPKVL